MPVAIGSKPVGVLALMVPVGHMNPRRVARVGVGRDHYLAVVAHPVCMGLRRLAHLDAVWRYVG